MKTDIFLKNKYTKWYYAIIDRAVLRVNIEPNEKHHIIPESFFIKRKRPGSIGWLEGNPNDPSNIVPLTEHEHFVCHLLLPKMTIGPAKHKALRAIMGMSTLHGIGQNRKRLTGRRYAEMARELSQTEMSEESKQKHQQAGKARAKKRKDAGLEGTFKDKKHSADSLLLMKLAAARPKSQAWKDSASKNRKGLIPHNKNKTFEELYGKELASELKKKVANVGEKNGFFGKKHTEEQRKKKSAEKLAAPKIKCYHCNKEVDSMNYARWHGDKCKHKENK
jgi:hypothetical protein